MRIGIALATLGFLAQSAQAATCDPTHTQCAAPNYGATTKDLICPPDDGGKSALCYSPSEPPTPVSLTCESNGNGFICEAMPQSWDYGVLKYSWTPSGAVGFNYPTDPNSPFVAPVCVRHGNGSLTVTVISPGYATASITRNLYCP